MAQMPIEVVDVGTVSRDSLGQAISLADDIQSEFVYLFLPQGEARGLRVHAYKNANLDNLLRAVRRFRLTLAGYHPYLIAFVDTQIGSGRFTNLFWGSLPAEGLAVVTIANVSDVIVPSNRMVAYYLYFLAVQTLCFIAPEHQGHDDTRGCVFDFMENKADIRKSMKPRALCDECRSTLVDGHSPIAPQHLDVLDQSACPIRELGQERGCGQEKASQSIYRLIHRRAKSSQYYTQVAGGKSCSGCLE